MPKIVDHEARRAEIVQAAWRLIAREGIEATTMRRLAEELGYANGALNGYFPNKRAILTAAFRHVYTATNTRYDIRRAAGERGKRALRLFLLEVFPFDEDRLLEARIVIPFMEYAAHDDDLRRLYDALMSAWIGELTVLIREMIEDDDAADDLDVEAAVNHVLAVAHGVQATGVLSPELSTPDQLERVILQIFRSLT